MIGGAFGQQYNNTIELDPKLVKILTEDQKATFKLLLASSDAFFIKPYQNALISNYDSDTTADKSRFKKDFDTSMNLWSEYNNVRNGTMRFSQPGHIGDRG